MNEEKIQLWESFLQTWPLERLKKMSLEEYTNLNRNDSFCYWIEAKTNALGGIWGGSSYKFGIFMRKDLTTEDKRSSYKTDGTYAWAEKYGPTKEDAFSVIRSYIADIVKFAVSGNLEKIEPIDLGHAVKWKIAALYNRNIPLIYKTEIVDYLMNHFKFDSKLPFHEKLLKLTSLAEGQHMITLSENLWSWWDAAKQQNLSSGSLDKNLEILHATAKAIGDEKAVRLFFSLFKEITTCHHLEENNEKYYTAALFTHKRLHLTLGSRYTLTVEKSKTDSKIGCYLRLGDLDSLNESHIPGVRISDFYHNKEKIGIWAEFPFDKFDATKWLPSIVEASAIELSQSKSQYRSRGLHNPWIYRAAYDETILNQLFNENLPVNFQIQTTTMNKIPPLNQILYGPPGTGKTYNTIDKALEIIDPVYYQANMKDRDLLKKRFDELLIKNWESGDNGQIAFVTFHQSMSYEDFIEGIKPKMLNLDEETAEEVDTLSYVIEKGIFTKICDRAKTSSQSDLAFDDLWSKFSDHVLRSKTDVIFKSTSSELKLEKELSSPDSFKVRYSKSWIADKEVGRAIFHVGKSTIQKLFNQKINLADPELRHWVSVRDVVGGGRATTHLAVYSSFFDYSGLAEVWKNQEFQKPFVLIIDEINRGNISQIFGELITLIEEDKRIGKDESLPVMLPYSKQKFSVPKNLYIIGTMNTADRSIEALDTALRRRFTFAEMPARPEIIKEHSPSDGMIDGVDLVLLLSAINSRIEKLLDKDHQIGHSYLMNIHNLDGLRLAFKNKIIPLLEEYFYGDFAKIGLVLGDAFVIQKPSNDFSFAAFSGMDNEVAADLHDRKVYQITPSENWTAEDFQSVYSNKSASPAS